MRGSWTLVLLVSVASTACSDDPQRLRLGGQCTLNSECDAPLVCRLERCRKECATTADCTVPLACVLDGEGLGACQLADERECLLDSECPAPLVCRREQCVNECGEDRDCVAGAKCEDVEGGRACIDPSTEACVFDGDCPPSSFCLGGRCRAQCFTDRDCGGSWECRLADSVCCDPDLVDPTDLFSCAYVPPPDAGTGGGDGAVSDGGTGTDGGGTVDAGPLLCGGAPLTGVRDLTVGGSYACVMRGSGVTTEVLCWGAFGEIGDPGGLTGSPCPVAIPALAGRDIVSLEAGGVHACAVLATGEVYCWGRNAQGELGVGTVGGAAQPPTQVPGITADGVVADWTNTCVWEAGMPAQCWGSNLWGQLGIGPCRACSTFLPSPGGDPRGSPQTVTVVTNPQDLAMGGGGIVCGIVAGSPECWGKSNLGGLGMGGGTVIDDAVDLAVGSDYGCAVRGGDGTVHCWGENFYGNLGDGTTTSRDTRAPVVGLPASAVQVEGANHTCAVLDDGSVWCWGNLSGGRGVPGMDVMSQPMPQMVIASGATEVGVGSGFTCAQVGDEVMCWGANGVGQLGIGVMDGVMRDTVVTVLGP